MAVESNSRERGVIYFSSVPRNIRPNEVRQHFNKFGEILRMKFIPFPKKERQRSSALYPLQYKEGWIEFAAQTDAIRAVDEMNARPVACKRLRKCYGQLWIVKYLQNFSFDELADSREGERRIRRMEEVAAKEKEKSANEAFRLAVLEASKKKNLEVRKKATKEKPQSIKIKHKKG